MPNWTNNVIRFSGTPEALKSVKAAVREEDEIFDFNQFLPCPPELRDSISPLQVVATEEAAVRINNDWTHRTQKHEGEGTIRAISAQERGRRLRDYGADDWYSWNMNNWGTKWQGSSAEILYEDGESIIISFETPWSAPHKLFKYLQEELKLTIVGGSIYEDGSEFELHGSLAAFTNYFTLHEEVEVDATDEVEDGSYYEWLYRYITVNDFTTVKSITA